MKKTFSIFALLLAMLMMLTSCNIPFAPTVTTSEETSNETTTPEVTTFECNSRSSNHS